MGIGIGISQQQNQSASNAQQGQSGIGGPIGDAIEGVCIGIGANVGVGNKGIGVTVGFTPFGNGCQSIDYGIGDLDIVQVGCDIIIIRSLLGITTTEVRKDPNCKEPEPPPPPPPPGPGAGPGALEENTFYHLAIWMTTSIQVEKHYYITPQGQLIYTEPSVITSTYSDSAATFFYEGGSPMYSLQAGTFTRTVTGPYPYSETVPAANTSQYTYSPCGPFLTFLAKNPDGGSITGGSTAAVTRLAGLGKDLNWYLSGPGKDYLGYEKSSADSSISLATRTDSLPCKAQELSPPPPNLFPPKKMTNCCDATTSMLRKLMKVLAVDEIEKRGVRIPKEFLAPGGQGHLKVDNYAELLLNLYRTVNRYGIDTPIVVKIKDVNKAKEGDQGVEVQFNSPAAAIQGLVELAIENKGDAATRLQIQVRLIYAVTRTLKIVAGIGETVREIIKMLGSPFKWTTTKLPLEFDLSAGKTKASGKGFGTKPGQNSNDDLAPGLEASDEDTTESMLPAILRASSYDLPIPRFQQSEDDIQDFLTKIILLLGRKQ